MKPLILLIAFSSLVGTAHAQVNKCVDAAGKTVYSQGPCPKGVKATSIATTPTAPPAATAAGKSADAAKGGGPKTAAELEQDFRKRQLDQAEARRKEEERTAQLKNEQENCAAARRQLASFELTSRQASINEKGERYFLDDKQIEQEKQRARQAVSSFCK